LLSSRIAALGEIQGSSSCYIVVLKFHELSTTICGEGFEPLSALAGVRRKQHAAVGVFFHQPHELRTILLNSRMPAFVTEYPQFSTASIKGFYKLLEHDKYKDIIINSLLFLVEDKRIKVYAFVIMPDHLHLIWQMQPLIHPQHVQRDFHKYTAQRIKHDLQKNHPELLLQFESDSSDRTCQFWKRRALSIELRTDKVYIQKLDYIPACPVRRALEPGKSRSLQTTGTLQIFFSLVLSNWN
jgi:putative transposase